MAPQIGVAVYSGDPGSRVERIVSEFLETVRGQCPDAVIIVGGYRGGMRLVVDGALERGLRVLLVLPREYEGDPVPHGVLVVRTGMDVRGRSVILVRSSDVLVVVGGASGTLMEAVTAYGLGVPVVYVVSTGLPTDSFAAAYPDGVLDPRIGRLIYYVGSGREAGEKACSLARRWA